MKPSIVVLDAYTTSPLTVDQSDSAHPSWKPLSELGSVTLYPRTKPEEILERASETSILLTNKVVLHKEILQQLPNLRYIGLMSTGTNAVDLEAARELGITVSNVPSYSTPTVAQHAIALLLELATKLSAQAELSRSGKWSNQPDFSITAGPIIELADKNFGIVGCGDIAQATARIAAALGMNILVHSRSKKKTDFACEWLEKEEFLHRADVISLHCPLTTETEKWIDSEALESMKDGAFLLNTGRGPLIDEDAVAEALQSGKLGGYGADVTSTEPPSIDNPLLKAPRTAITPHVAWASTEARTRLMATLASNISAFLAERPQNTV
ncbi:D-2-hydroxyacid dehydrogenase [Puniceicoccus vermicola]|uniref:D-2-hydroxyacid dehydrogenase n=1 Tax=Puniceicoccus vermicola TaxID=388746 RepID=A0A7X1E3Q6_9BACT|nr:D-2-hydroxyacid dehydrogenase [Puniceicoccus vermicola]MBC2601311.1 D-2-hydroxyacid dehydrogenase [Puniceicoccus vermicola]